jgi:hypothetical protein
MAVSLSGFGRSHCVGGPQWRADQEWWMRRHPTAPANVAGSVATFGPDFTAPEAAFVPDAVSVAQHPMCSLSGTAFATPLSKIFGSMFEEPGLADRAFFLYVFEPGGPQRENACGPFIPVIVYAACKMKRERAAVATGFPRQDLFRGRGSPPRASPCRGRSLIIEGRCQL